MRILIVDDDADWRQFLQEGLAFEGFKVQLAANGEEGIERAMEEPYDAILVDVLMPEMDGFSFVQKLRDSKIGTAILMVTCQGQERDKLKGFSRGADDYLVKPVSLAELVARIHSVVRRISEARERHPDPFVLTAGGLTLHLLKREVVKDGIPIAVTKTEFILLECLLRRPGHVLSRQVLGQHILSGDFPVSANVIDVHMKNIRDKIDSPSGHSLIRTVRGFGYTLHL